MSRRDPRRIAGRTVFRGRVFCVERDRVRMTTGRTIVQDVVRHARSVVLVPQPAPGQVILIRQYRHAAGSVLLEIPAGGLRAGEDPIEAALRELEEETGYRAGRIVERARFWTTPGFTTEFMYLYEASGLVKTQINPDEDEVIEVDIVRSREALQMIDDGRIQDAKSILGLLRVLK